MLILKNTRQRINKSPIYPICLSNLSERRQLKFRSIITSQLKETTEARVLFRLKGMILNNPNTKFKKNEFSLPLDTEKSSCFANVIHSFV